MAFLSTCRNFRVSLSTQKVKCNLLHDVNSYLFELGKSKGVTVFGSELHESHVGWVGELCDNTETGKQPAFQRNIWITLTIQHGIFYNNIFMSEWYLAVGIKLHAIIRAGHATSPVLCGARKMKPSFPKNMLTNILAP